MKLQPALRGMGTLRGSNFAIFNLKEFSPLGASYLHYELALLWRVLLPKEVHVNKITKIVSL